MNSKKLEKIFKEIFHSDLVDPTVNHAINKLYYNTKLTSFSSDIKTYKPLKSQSIVNISHFVIRLFEFYSEVVVFALDAISYKYFSENISGAIPVDSLNYRLGCLSSVFPSTTGAAWPSIVTGVTPSQHGVYGTSFTHEALGKNYFWYEDIAFHKGTASKVNDNKIKLNLSKNPTLFSKLREMSIDSFYIGTDGNSSNNIYRNEITDGAIHDEPIINDYFELIEKPIELTNYYFNKTHQYLARDNRKKLLWNYINFDSFIHKYGYDELTKNISWIDFIKNINDISNSKNRAVVIISDHGQTPQKPLNFNILDLADRNPDLEFNAGGAGRMVFIYPKKNKINQARKWLKNLVGDSGIVLTKTEAIAFGLFEKQTVMPERIGDLIAIATKPDFPSTGANLYSFEHGALTEDELFVPILIKF